MRNLRGLLAAPIACVTLLADICALPAPAVAEQWVGRSVTLGGRKVHCNNAEIMIDRELPSEGGAGDDFVILNPDMLKSQPETVRIFVFTHECGHLTVGDSELKADCYAVQQGVRERWLDQKGLDQVCQSFDGAPETESHPSAARRCRNLDQCYAKALAALPATKSAATATIAPSPSPAKRAPTAKTAAAKAKAPSAPAAVAPPPAAQVAPPPPAEGVPATAESAEAARKAVSAWRCTEPLQVSAAGEDPIAHLIGEDARVAANCR